MNTVENVFRILNEKSIEYKKSEHEPVTTSEEAAKVRGVPLNSGVKAMLLKTKEGKFIIALVPADKKVDLKKISELENTKIPSLATAEEVLAQTGCDIGGVPPFGYTKRSYDHRIKTYMDNGILDNDFANFNAGDRSVSVTMKAKDLPKVVDAILF